MSSIVPDSRTAALPLSTGTVVIPPPSARQPNISLGIDLLAPLSYTDPGLAAESGETLLMENGLPFLLEFVP